MTYDFWKDLSAASFSCFDPLISPIRLASLVQRCAKYARWRHRNAPPVQIQRMNGATGENSQHLQTCIKKKGQNPTWFTGTPIKPKNMLNKSANKSSTNTSNEYNLHNLTESKQARNPKQKTQPLKCQKSTPKLQKENKNKGPDLDLSDHRWSSKLRLSFVIGVRHSEATSANATQLRSDTSGGLSLLGDLPFRLLDLFFFFWGGGSEINWLWRMVAHHEIEKRQNEESKVWQKIRVGEVLKGFQSCPILHNPRSSRLAMPHAAPQFPRRPLRLRPTGCRPGRLGEVAGGDLPPEICGSPLLRPS